MQTFFLYIFFFFLLIPSKAECFDGKVFGRKWSDGEHSHLVVWETPTSLPCGGVMEAFHYTPRYHTTGMFEGVSGRQLIGPPWFRETSFSRTDVCLIVGKSSLPPREKFCNIKRHFEASPWDPSKLIHFIRYFDEDSACYPCQNIRRNVSIQ